MRKLLITLLLLTSCKAPLYFSYGYSPYGYPQAVQPADEQEFFTFLGTQNNNKGALLVGTSWRDDQFGVTDGGGAIPAVIAPRNAQAAANNFTNIIIIDWRSGQTLLMNQPAPGDTTNSWSNSESKTKLLNMLKSLISTYKPKYLFLGNEINEYTGPDYSQMVDFYNSAYPQLKALNSATKLGVIFQYESLSGHQSLRVPGAPADWGKLTQFDLAKLDVIGLTLYPMFDNANPNLIPANYLQPLKDRIGTKPVVITETGWPSEDLIPDPNSPPWVTSPQAQVDYINKMPSFLNAITVEVMGWLFYQPLKGPIPEGFKIFSPIALFDSNKNKLPSYDLWVAQTKK